MIEVRRKERNKNIMALQDRLQDMRQVLFLPLLLNSPLFLTHLISRTSKK